MKQTKLVFIVALCSAAFTFTTQADHGRMLIPKAQAIKHSEICRCDSKAVREEARTPEQKGSARVQAVRHSESTVSTSSGDPDLAHGQKFLIPKSREILADRAKRFED